MPDYGICGLTEKPLHSMIRLLTFSLWKLLMKYGQN